WRCEGGRPRRSPPTARASCSRSARATTHNGRAPGSTSRGPVGSRGIFAGRAGDPAQRSRTRVNLARSLRQSGNLRAAREALDGELLTAEQSSPSRESSLLLVSIGLGYRELRAAGPGPAGELLLRAARALSRAREIAGQAGDRRTLSYATGYLGTLYEDERHYDEALQLTREAIFSAQQAHAPEALYRWQWQVARLHRKMGADDEALTAYRAAVQQVAAVRPA